MNCVEKPISASAFSSGLLKRTRRRPWEVARWGRLLAGSSMLAFTALGLLHHQAWFVGAMVVSLNLVVTSLTDHCPLRNALLQFGLREREDLFLPGGLVRSEVSENTAIRN